MTSSRPARRAVLGDQQLDGPRADALPALTDEQVIGRDGRAHLEIGGDRLPSIDVQRQDPELAALARADGQRALALRDLDVPQPSGWTAR